MLSEGFNAENFVVGMIVIVLSIALHEFGHAFSADRLGDPLPRSQGRVTLWPDKHFDPLGLLMIVVTQLSGYGIGWGKPVQISGGYFKNPRRDDIIVTIAGPAMNLLLAVIAAIVFRVIVGTGNEELLFDPQATYADGLNIYSVPGKFIMMTLFINVSLMLFNLIPIFPLDGSHILRNLLPHHLARAYTQFMVQYGPMLLLGLVLLGRDLLRAILGPARMAVVQVLLGS